MKKMISLLVLAISVLILVTACEKEDEAEDDLLIEIGNFTDTRDGQIYKWVKIKNQIWMAENLKYLPNVIAPEIQSQTLPYYYVYGYSGMDTTVAKATFNYQTYGVLYNWPASLTCCPTDWHLPNYEEWIQLIETVGKKAGMKLKASNGWLENGNGSDRYNFTALPGGFRYHGYEQEYFGFISYFGNWWIVDQNDELAWAAWFMGMNSYSDNVDVGYIGNKANGLSVRCIKD